MAILPDYVTPHNRGKPIVGSGASSISSTMFTMWTNAKTASSEATDPYKIVYGAGNNNNLCKPIVVPGMGQHLEINIAYWGTKPTDDLPVVACYGEIPWNGQTVNRLWPQDVDATITPTSADGTAYDNAIWVPLMDWDSYEYQTDEKDADASNLIGLNPSGIVAVDSDGGDTTGIRMGCPRRVSTTGCTRVICVVATAADNVDNAVIVGRFIG